MITAGGQHALQSSCTPSFCGWLSRGGPRTGYQMFVVGLRKVLHIQAAGHTFVLFCAKFLQILRNLAEERYVNMCFALDSYLLRGWMETLRLQNVSPMHRTPWVVSFRWGNNQSPGLSPDYCSIVLVFQYSIRKHSIALLIQLPLSLPELATSCLLPCSTWSIHEKSKLSCLWDCWRQSQTRVIPIVFMLLKYLSLTNSTHIAVIHSISWVWLRMLSWNLTRPVRAQWPDHVGDCYVMTEMKTSIVY